ncbi:MAG: hypothetical protein ACXV3F_11065 [Frankiaceae bacterium]
MSQVFGPNITSYEWVYVVAPDRLPALTGELGETAGDDVLTLLQAHHDGEPGGLDAILRSPSIDTQFDNWHGSADADPAEEASCEPVDAGSTRAEEAPVQAEPGASSTARAEPSVTTEGERGEPVTDNELPPRTHRITAARPIRARQRFVGARRTGLRLGSRLVLRLIHDSEEQVIEWGDSVTEAREKSGPGRGTRLRGRERRESVGRPSPA